MLKKIGLSLISKRMMSVLEKIKTVKIYKKRLKTIYKSKRRKRSLKLLMMLSILITLRKELSLRSEELMFSVTCPVQRKLKLKMMKRKLN